MRKNDSGCIQEKQKGAFGRQWRFGFTGTAHCCRIRWKIQNGKKGATVKAWGGSPKVDTVKGNEVTMKVTKAKAAKVKVDSNVTVTESDGEEMQGC